MSVHFFFLFACIFSVGIHFKQNNVFIFILSLMAFKITEGFQRVPSESTNLFVNNSTIFDGHCASFERRKESRKRRCKT